jgi:hypothetical protein
MSAMRTAAEVDLLSAQVEAAKKVAEDLMAHNPGHGDYLSAGRRIMEALDEVGATSLEREHRDGHYGCVHSIGHCNHPEWD